MIFKPYPKYTSCAIQWFNEIPQSWKQVRVEQYLIKKDENIGDLWSSTQLLSLTQKGIIEKDINDGKGKTHSDYSTYQAIDIGDLVFCLFDIDETPRTVGLSTKKGMITSAYTAFKSKENINTQYLYYFFESLDDAKALKPYYKGLRKTVRPPEFLKIHVPFPPKVEQVAISQFLDTETARIDNLINKQQKLIELLEEQRKSIISHTVTKGLNPNAPMKDSGVEWLGEVPESWQYYSIKRTLKILTDYTANGSFADLAKNVNYLDYGYSRLVRLTDLRENLDNSGIYVTEDAHRYLKKSELFGGELLLANVGAYAGLACLMPYKEIKATLAPNMFLLRFKEQKINNQFMYYLINSKAIQHQFQVSMTSTAQPKLNKDNVKNIVLFLPSLDIQNEIVQFLDFENLKFDNLISKQKNLIEKLKEYRSSIISHAVTGKIDVREWVA